MQVTISCFFTALLLVQWLCSSLSQHIPSWVQDIAFCCQRSRRLCTASHKTPPSVGGPVGRKGSTGFAPPPISWAGEVK